jgi:ABC-2 type transport system permease protein
MSPRSDFRFGFWLVFRRELARLRRRPFLFALITVFPLGLMTVLSLIFSAGLATHLSIGVLDLDDSAFSHQLIRMVDATPDAAVVASVNDLGEGRRMILSGEIRGLLMLPRNLERDVLAGRRPEAVFFYNTQTLTVGNLVLRGVSAAVNSAEAGVQLSLRTAQGEPIDIAQEALTPVPVQTHALFNPTLNYAHFLLAALLPGVLQIVIVTSSAFAVGLDAETRYRFRVLRRLGGGLWPAMAGKLLPYTFIFLTVLGVADAVLFGIFELPLRGSSTLLLLAGFLFILAGQFIGAVLALFLRPLGTAIGIGSMITSPAFGFMGIGFPRLGMNAFAYGWGSLLPGTWYLTARIDQTIRGTPLDLSWKPILILLAFVVGLAGLAAWRLEVIRAQTDRPDPSRALAEKIV